MPFTEDNQPKERKPRGKGKKSLMLDAIRANCKTGKESEFLENVVKASIGDPLADPPVPPNIQLMSLVLQRVEAPLKSTVQLTEFDFPEDGTPAEKTISIISSISQGLMPVDVGQSLIGIIKDSVIIEESTELKHRIEALEALVNG